MSRLVKYTRENLINRGYSFYGLSNISNRYHYEKTIHRDQGWSIIKLFIQKEYDNVIVVIHRCENYYFVPSRRNYLIRHDGETSKDEIWWNKNQSFTNKFLQFIKDNNMKRPLSKADLVTIKMALD